MAAVGILLDLIQDRVFKQWVKGEGWAWLLKTLYLFGSRATMSTVHLHGTEAFWDSHYDVRSIKAMMNSDCSILVR